ncbi:hypothetical protein V6N13_105051 [Hibiscus sabdariffa]|uniref:Uncharacterized protein n=2 Tax=Hibiscus sabdariffa TaxID=183260 RepID=A0ABR2AW80_9ROSI
MAGTYTHATLHHWASQRRVAMALALVAAILLSPLTTSSPSSCSRPNGGRAWLSPSPDPTWVLRTGGSSWGLSAILVMLMLVGMLELGWDVEDEEVDAGNGRWPEKKLPCNVIGVERRSLLNDGHVVIWTRCGKRRRNCYGGTTATTSIEKTKSDNNT